MSPSRRGPRIAGWVVLLTLVVTGCSADPSDTGRISTEIGRASPTSTPRPRPPAQLGGDEPGALLGIEPMDEITADIADLGASTYRILFRSTGVEGEPRRTSGVLVVPGGSPPDGGWLVIAYGHGTTGLLPGCAPSDHPDLLGNAVTVADLVAKGFAVVMPDYQGLGAADGGHPFLDGRVLGENLIDSVRAARHADRRLSTRWGALGGSLGGLAAWSAAELAPTYGRGLKMVGAAAAAPVADMSGLAGRAYRGQLGPDQRLLYVFAVAGLARTRDDLDPDDYRSARAAARWRPLLRCNEKGATRRARILGDLGAADLAPRTAAARDRLADELAAMAVPHAPAEAPMLVLFGEDDTLVPAAWTARALAKACAAGSLIEYHLCLGEGHDLDSSMMLPWLQARFDGQEPLDTCGLAP